MMRTKIALGLITLFVLVGCEAPVNREYKAKIDCLEKEWLWIDQRGTRVACIDPDSENLVAILKSADEAN